MSGIKYESKSVNELSSLTRTAAPQSTLHGEKDMAIPRILIADDHKIVLEGIQSLVAEKYNVVGTAGDGHTLLKMARKERPDVVVTDISMPSLNGIEVVERLQRMLPDTKVIVLTMHADIAYAMRALQAGASGYVLKDCAAWELITAIGEVLKDRTYVTSEITKNVFKGYQEAEELSQIGAVGVSRRHREVLQLLAEGRSAKEIGSILHISHRTVYSHRKTLMKRLNLKNTADIVRYALNHGIIVRE